MSVKDVTVRLFADSKDAQAKLDRIYAEAEEIGRLNPTIKFKIDKAAQTQALSVLRGELKNAAKDAETLSGDLAGVGTSAAEGAPGLTSMLTPMTGLVGAAIALSPVIVTVGFGMAGFGAAAYSAIDPVIKAAQATGGLAANMHKLNPEQQDVARGLLGLKSNYDTFTRSLQPEVFKVLNAGLGVAKTLLTEVEPVAKATGGALATVIANIGHGLQDQEWRSFFAWMAQNAGPDVLLLGKALGALASDLPPLLEDLQPVATALLHIVTAAGEVIRPVATAVSGIEQLGRAGNDSSNGLVRTVAGVKDVSQVVIPVVGPLLALAGATKKTGVDATYTGPPVTVLGSAVKVFGNNAQTSAAQVTALYDALHKLLDPLTADINAAVTFKDDQVALAAALKKSHDVLGLHTQAQRDSASATSQAAQDALTLSQNIYTQTGSARKALGPLEALAGQLQAAGAKGAYARDILRELKAAEDRLYSKKITIGIAYDLKTFGTAPGGGTGVGGGHILTAASGGYRSGLTMVGEMGRELVQLPPNSYVYNHQQTSQIMNSAGTGGGKLDIDIHFVEPEFRSAFKASIRNNGGNPNVIGR